MSLVVGSAGVASAMSELVEGALYADEIFQDGITFTSKYQKSEAGQIQVVKYSGDHSLEPQVPGSDFKDSAYANTVVEINCVNAFQKSQKVPGYYEATMPVDVKAGETVEVTKAIAEGRQKSGIACLIKEGTTSSDTAVITASNIKDKVLAERAALRKKFAKPDVVLASVDVYTEMLKAAGKDYVPMTNEEVIRTGRVGMWMGMVWIECELFGQTTAFKYKDGTTTQSQSAEKVDLIMYDHNALSIIDVLAALRIVDSENFFGSKIQEEVDTGFKVTNTDCVTVKTHA